MHKFETKQFQILNEYPLKRIRGIKMEQKEIKTDLNLEKGVFSGQYCKPKLQHAECGNQKPITVNQEQNAAYQEQNAVNQEQNAVNQEQNAVNQEQNAVKQEQMPVNQEQMPVNQEQMPVNQGQMPVYQEQIPLNQPRNSANPRQGDLNREQRPANQRQRQINQGSVNIGNPPPQKPPIRNNNCSNCPHKGKMDILPLAIVAVTALVIIGTLFLAGIFCITALLVHRQIQTTQSAQVQQADPFYPQYGVPGVQKDINATAGNFSDVEDAARSDLSYSVKWEKFEYDENSDTVNMVVEYPVISGDVPNLDIINDAIIKEKNYLSDYYKEYSQYMLEGEIFNASAIARITYMDEDRISVVFCEKMETDYWTDNGLFCINIDMQNGVVIDNSSIIELDQDFVKDLRTKSKDQNGSESIMELMSDKEIMEYLLTKDTLIIYYTPAGLKIGINYDESYITAEYEEYDQFLKKY